MGNKTNVDEATRKASDLPIHKEIIEIASDSDMAKSMPTPFVIPKAHRLVKLTAKASDATDNLALSNLVREFVEVLRSNSSKTLTREATQFLDALHKQLADPSVFVAPLG